MQNTYDGMDPVFAFREYALSMLNGCLIANSLSDAKASFDKLKRLVQQENIRGETKRYFNRASRLFAKLLRQYSGSDSSSLEDESYRQVLTQLRDEILEAADTFEAS